MRRYQPVSYMFAVFGLFLCQSVAGADGPPGPSQVLVHVKVTQTLPDGKQRVLCEPNLVTLLGRPASFSAGGEISPPRGVAVQEKLRYGTFADFNVFRKEGRLFLDATLNVAELNRADADSARVTTTGLRVVEAIAFGKAVVLRGPDGTKERWELLVEELEPKEPAPNGQHPAAAAGCQRGVR